MKNARAERSALVATVTALLVLSGCGPGNMSQITPTFPSLRASQADNRTMHANGNSLPVNPATLTFASATPKSFTVSDLHYTKALTVESSNRNIAIVSPTAQNGPAATFTVTPVSGGTSTIVVSDSRGRRASVKVSVSGETVKLDATSAGSSASPKRNAPKYISPSTQSMTLAIPGQADQLFNLTPNSPACSAGKKTGYLSCSILAFAPVGEQTQTITLYDQPNGRGYALSSASTRVKVTAGSVTTVPLVLSGVVTTAVVSLNGLSNVTVEPGKPANVRLTVSAYDADGNLIIGPGGYHTPITLADSNRSGATTLSAKAVDKPGVALTLKYDGSKLSSATITPSILRGFPQASGAATLTTGTPPGGPAITQYPIPTQASSPFGITAGSNDTLWFTEAVGHKIGRIDARGHLTEYPLPTSGAYPQTIVLGSDGALWFTDFSLGAIDRMTTAGTVTAQYVLPIDVEKGEFSYPFGITAGPDGALWFTGQVVRGPAPTIGEIGRVTTTGSITEYTIPATGSNPQFIVAGPDHALWFADYGTNSIGRITTTGRITEYSVQTASANFPSTPQAITVGPDGALWFTEYQQSSIGRITTNGTITQYTIPYNGSGSIALGPDDALWFTEPYQNAIGRITTQGVFTNYTIPVNSSFPTTIVAGPSRTLWFTEQRANAIGSLQVP